MGEVKLFTVWVSTSLEMAVQAKDEVAASRIALANIDEELGNQDCDWNVDSVTEGSPGSHWKGCHPYRADDDESPERTCDAFEADET